MSESDEVVPYRDTGDTSGGMMARRGADGKPTFVFREADPTADARMTPIINDLKYVIELLGDPEPEIGRALKMLRAAAAAIQGAFNAMPSLEDPERKEALAELGRTIRKLQKIQKGQ